MTRRWTTCSRAFCRNELFLRTAAVPRLDACVWAPRAAAACVPGVWERASKGGTVDQGRRLHASNRWSNVRGFGIGRRRGRFKLSAGVRRGWAAQVGEPSRLVVRLHVEAAASGSGRDRCRVRGCVGVPSPPNDDAERYHLAGILVGHAGLPKLTRIAHRFTILGHTSDTLEGVPG